MSDKKTGKKSEKKNNKRKMKCAKCEFYDNETDYCTEREIENCSRQTNVNFSKCDNYLIKESLVMF